MVFSYLHSALAAFAGIKSPNTQQLIIETRTHHRPRPRIHILRLRTLAQQPQRLNIAPVIHTAVLLELGQHLEPPPVVLAVGAQSQDTSAGMHAAREEYAAATTE